MRRNLLFTLNSLLLALLIFSYPQIISAEDNSSRVDIIGTVPTIEKQIQPVESLEQLSPKIVTKEAIEQEISDTQTIPRPTIWQEIIEAAQDITEKTILPLTLILVVGTAGLTITTGASSTMLIARAGETVFRAKNFNLKPTTPGLKALAITALTLAIWDILIEPSPRSISLFTISLLILSW